ncbi:MAG: TonB-dependent receptor [Candidatus Latescibacteria bacterium]|nr:TonB-dependent receptor [Candidatus Latescibacterota bacterium]
MGWLCLVGLLFLAAGPARAQASDDLFRFFAEEARVISASRIPQAESQAPATVYVVSGEELRTSGSQTLWDALRAVPGVDIALFRTFQGRVSIRGLNKSFNNRTLVLVDGGSTSLGSVDQSLWEVFPLLLAEVERIEVVEGPVSALYGANALNGVINIVTKKPAQLGGGLISYGGGERQTQNASLLYGRQLGKMGYKFGLAWRTTNRFEDADRHAGTTYRGNGQLSYAPGPHTQLSLTGGLTDMDIQGSGDWLSLAQSKGKVGFLRAEGAHRHTHAQVFLSRTDLDLDFTFWGRQANERDHTYDFSVDHLISLSERSTAVIGAGYRNSNSNTSNYVSAGSSMWSAFAEHRWQPAPRWELWTSARVDRKSHTEAALSPRLSLIFTPVPSQTLRLSMGTAYRNPTVLENYLAFTDQVVVGKAQINVETVGRSDLRPEQAKLIELAYQLERGRFRTRLVGFHYQLDDLIYSTISGVTLSSPTDIAVRVAFGNQAGAKAWGGETSVEFPWGKRVTGFANYSYQDLSGATDPAAAGAGTPHHKLNGGLRFASGRFSANTSAHWVSHTLWLDRNLISPRYQRVPAYTLLNLHLGYAFGGPWQGLELGLDAFNLFDHPHYETLPTKDLSIGQSGEIVRARRTLNMIYRFG